MKAKVKYTGATADGAMDFTSTTFIPVSDSLLLSYSAFIL